MSQKAKIKTLLWQSGLITSTIGTDKWIYMPINDSLSRGRNDE